MSSQVLSDQEYAAVEAFVRLIRAHAATTRLLSADLLEQHDLTISDYEALLRLSRADGNVMRRVDLARELLLTPSGVTRLLNGLERAGLVEKAACDSDARVTYAVLTDDGRSRLEEASRSHRAAIRALFAAVYDDGELASLADLLSRLPGVSELPGSACDVE